MTDNTPRPSEHSEPMTKDEVCSFLRAAGAFGGVPYDELCKVTNAVAALYERCEALERAVEVKHKALLHCERHCPCGARPESLSTHPHVPGCPVPQALACNGAVTMDDVVRPLGKPSYYVFTGTEASDAEGGG